MANKPLTCTLTIFFQIFSFITIKHIQCFERWNYKVYRKELSSILLGLRLDADDSRCWTFLPVTHNNLGLLKIRDKLQSDKMASGMKVHINKKYELNSSIWENLHPLTFTETCWMFTESKQQALLDRVYCISAMCIRNHILDPSAQFSLSEVHLSQLINANQQIMTMILAMLGDLKVCGKSVSHMLTQE